MLGVRFIKTTPTTFVMHYASGKLQKEGTGLAFFYYAPSSTIVSIPLATSRAQFLFEVVSADFQDVTIQGQISYRVADPKALSRALDYTIYPNGRYVSDDPRKLEERLVEVAQVLANAIGHRLKLRELLLSQELLVTEITAGLKASASVTMLGIEILDVSVVAIKPSPETAKALEAAARESLMREADEAIYARRNAAVALERQIRESELNTEIAVEEKKRQIRETQMNGEIAVEEQRGKLIEKRSDNERRDADTKAYALSAMIAPVKDIDWHTLLALSAAQMDPKQSIAMAFRELAENAQKIGTLNLTPDLLSALLTDSPAGGDGSAPPSTKQGRQTHGK